MNPVEMFYQRDVYGQTLVELGRRNPDVVVLDADLSGSTRTGIFAKEFPARFFNFGVAEQNMMATAAGLASCGKIVFASTFAIFATGRAWDQVRNTVCYSNFNIKIVATHAGISVGPDGSSHQAVEDIALMRVIPNMTILVPCDGPQTREIILKVAEYPGPVYVRLGRPKVVTVSKKDKFQLGKADVLCRGKDISIIACGIMVKEALDAASVLEKEGIGASVINMHTIKPLDVKTIIDEARSTRRMVVCEEHMITGGLGSAVSEVLSEEIPTPLIRIGIKNRFGQSGDPAELMKEYNLTSRDIANACKKLL